LESVLGPDEIITASDLYEENKNAYITMGDVFDPVLILRAECFKLPSSEEYFIDFIFHLNRVYRKRLGVVRKRSPQNTRMFKHPNAIISTLEGLGIGEIDFFIGDRANERIQEVGKHE
jgi:hypothetical protein